MNGLLARTVMLCLPPFLAACVNMSGLGGGSQYGCAAPDGVACDSVSGTYANALHHRLPSQQAERRTAPVAPSILPAASTSAPVRLPPASDPASVERPGQAKADAQRPPHPLRSPPRVLRLWIKPWEDVDGDLFDQGHVYVQVDGGRWQIRHVPQALSARQPSLLPPPASTAGPQTTDAAPGATPPTHRPAPAGLPTQAPASGSGRIP